MAINSLAIFPMVCISEYQFDALNRHAHIGDPTKGKCNCCTYNIMWSIKYETLFTNTGSYKMQLMVAAHSITWWIKCGPYPYLDP